MDEGSKKIVKKYFVDGRYKKEDSDRLAEKGVKQAFGDGEYSDATMTAARYVVTGYQAQEKEDKRRAGGARKRAEGIWREVKRLRTDHRDTDPESAWFAMDGAKVDSRWDLYIDHEYLCQEDLKSGKTTKIKQSTFTKNYFSKV